MKTKILVILLAALGLRLVNLNQSLWLDEAIEWWGVKSFGLRELLTGYMAGDFNPPGHHVLMWFWVRFFGDSEIALRMPSVLFGVGTIWWVYKIGRTLDRGDRGGVGLLAAGMAAVNGLLIYYSQEARMYAMAAFLVTGGMYFFMKGEKDKREKKDKKIYLLYFGFMAAALYSHYLTWLLLPFAAIWGVRYLAPLLVTVPWWPMLWRQLQAGMAAAGNPMWAQLSQTNFKNLGLVAVKFVTGRVPWPDGWGQLGVGVIVLGFWMIIFIGVIRVISPSTRLTLRRPVRRRSQRASVRGSGVPAEFSLWRKFRVRPKDFRLILVLWAVGPLILGGLIGLVIPVFTYFRFLFVVPPILILMALPQTMLASARPDVTSGRSRRAMVRGSDAPAIFPAGKIGIIRRILGVCLSGVMLVFSIAYLSNSNNHREDWRGAVEELHRLDEAAAVIIHPAVRPPFDYYDRGKSLVVERQATSNKQQVWYIPYAQAIFDPEDLTRKFLRDEEYVRTFERHFRGVTLERWNSGIASL